MEIPKAISDKRYPSEEPGRGPCGCRVINCDGYEVAIPYDMIEDAEYFGESNVIAWMKRLRPDIFPDTVHDIRNVITRNDDIDSVKTRAIVE